MATQPLACPACGSTANEPGDRACRQCEAALPLAPAAKRRRSAFGSVFGLLGIVIGVVLVVVMLYLAGVGQSASP